MSYNEAEALTKAQTIEDAVYDLKAVTPNEKKVGDTPTLAELLTAIDEKGREVDAALKTVGERGEAAIDSA